MASFERASSVAATAANSANPLFEAATRGDAENVANILDGGNKTAPDLEERCGDGKAALHLASESGHTAVVRTLLEHGAHVDAVQRATGDTPLHLAARNGHTDVARILLADGADAEALNMPADTPLSESARQGWLLMVQMLLLDADVHVDPRNQSDSTPLIEAARRGHVQVVRALLENGADADATESKDGRTALIAAAAQHTSGEARGGIDVSRVLLEAGASVERRDARGSTALQYAARAGNMELARLLLEHGADPASWREASDDEHREYVSGIPFPNWARRRNMHIPLLIPMGMGRAMMAPKKRSRWPGWTQPSKWFESSSDTTSGDTPESRPAWRFWSWLRRRIPGHLDDELVETDSSTSVDRPGKQPSGGETAPRRSTRPNTLDDAMRRLLETPQKLHGPRLQGSPDRRTPPRLGTSFVTPPQKWEVDKRNACEGHDVSMLQFCVGGAQEQRLSVQATVHEVLYGKGPTLLLDKARQDANMTEAPDFTWFHIPATNLTWVEHLITRLREEQSNQESENDNGTGTTRTTKRKWRCMDDALRADLRLVQPQQGQGVSFLKSMSNVLEIPTWDGSDTEHAATLVLPYLHYETCTSFFEMTMTMNALKSWDPNQLRQRFLQRNSAAAANAPEGQRRMANAGAERIQSESQEKMTMNDKSSKPLPFFDWNAAEHELDKVMGGRPKHDLPKSGAESHISLPGLEAHRPKAWSTGYTPSDMYNDETASHTTFPQRRRRRYTTRPPLRLASTDTLPPRISGQDESLRASTHPHPRPPPPPLHPSRSLLRGYLAASPPEAQPRRSLDQYRYTDTRRRAADQVVTRHCAKHGHLLPKPFIVDQLWLWVLGSHTLITCAAAPWDPRQAASEMAHLRDAVTGRPMYESMHMPKAVLNYLTKAQRKPVVDVHALASVVVRQCVATFQWGSVPHYLHFFEFFEESVANVVESVASCLQDMKNQYDATGLAKIGREMRKLVEVADILDELDMLREVLTEQSATIQEYNKQILKYLSLTKDWPSTGSTSTRAAPVVPMDIAENHLARIEVMETQAKKAQKMLFRITDWKQKHNSHIEALASGRQAKAAATQAEVMAKQSSAVLLFTVITIIFLPISFMAAFFAIPADSFTFNPDGKLPMNYVIKCMVSVGLGLSVPLIVIAFNLDKVAAVLRAIAAPVSRSSWSVFGRDSETSSLETSSSSEIVD